MFLYNYLYIKSPMISRIAYIEKTSKKLKDTKSKYILKRTKPLKTTRYTLQSSMGLKKIISSNNK